MPTTLEKAVTEARIFAFDYSNFIEIVGGDTVASAIVDDDPIGLTIGAPIILADRVQVLISGGVFLDTYTLTCTATTAGGSDLVVCGLLTISQCGT